MKAKRAELLEAPMYRIVEVSSYLGIPPTTLRDWTRKHSYSTSSGKRNHFKPVIALAIPEPPTLSFANLLEAHILNALRRYGLSLQAIRRALTYVEQQFPSSHPLLSKNFATDGKSLILDNFGSLIDATRGGQMILGKMIDAHLRRIGRDHSGSPVMLYPFVRKQPTGKEMLDELRVIVIRPELAFGRPVLAGTGIPIEEIVGRHSAGESIRNLADDYERPEAEIEEAIRFREAA